MSATHDNPRYVNPELTVEGVKMSVEVVSYELTITEPDGSRGPRLFADRSTLLDQIDRVMTKSGGRKITVAMNGGIVLDA
jgi:hypothetical protein